MPQNKRHMCLNKEALVSTQGVLLPGGGRIYLLTGHGKLISQQVGCRPGLQRSQNDVKAAEGRWVFPMWPAFQSWYMFSGGHRVVTPERVVQKTWKTLGEPVLFVLRM